MKAAELLNFVILTCRDQIRIMYKLQITNRKDALFYKKNVMYVFSEEMSYQLFPPLQSLIHQGKWNQLCSPMNPTKRSWFLQPWEFTVKTTGRNTCVGN